MTNQEQAPRKPKKSHPWRQDAIPQKAIAARKAQQTAQQSADKK